ncbi:uncharacterized protein LOC133330137 [Musca vetustissima]|uniref:uncharacterized protein LOC133330137 n=1 Tax=Musca vetustissima TaxID=27455 RepID=UPI002AB7585B|nr:uncharacterized protein LOC133330137 [Musca vetustissima]
MFFSNLLVAFGFGLYIAIEMKFELPPMDHILIAMSLFIPHFMVAGALRMHTLKLWLLRRKLSEFKDQLIMENSEKEEKHVIVEIINPVLKEDLKDNTTPSEIFTSIDVNNEIINKCDIEEKPEATPVEVYRNVADGTNALANYLSSTNKILQRQLLVLNGLNYNCLLYGIYTKLYFEKQWHPIFTDRNRRVFYAANTLIFVCIFLDYFLLSMTLLSFKKMIEVLMLFSIAVTVLYQYFNDQIVALTELVDSSNDE